MNSLTTWFSQVTTGHGFMILAPTLLSVLSGQMTWSTATPLLVAGAIGVVWPENTALQSAGQATAADLASVVAAYNNKTGTATPAVKPPV
jgi:hypothetical protein